MAVSRTTVSLPDRAERGLADLARRWHLSKSAVIVRLIEERCHAEEAREMAEGYRVTAETSRHDAAVHLPAQAEVLGRGE